MVNVNDERVKPGIRDLRMLPKFVLDTLYNYRDRVDVTPEEVAYFREHPDEIEKFSSPLNLHKLFLLAGTVFGILLIGLSKVIKFSSLLNY